MYSYIDVDTLGRLLATLSLPSNGAAVKTAVAALDTDGTGMIEESDFLDWAEQQKPRYNKAVYTSPCLQLLTHMPPRFSIDAGNDDDDDEDGYSDDDFNSPLPTSPSKKESAARSATAAGSGTRTQPGAGAGAGAGTGVGAGGAGGNTKRAGRPKSGNLSRRGSRTGSVASGFSVFGAPPPKVTTRAPILPRRSAVFAHREHSCLSPLVEERHAERQGCSPAS